jgi:hypothetical protein
MYGKIARRSITIENVVFVDFGAGPTKQPVDEFQELAERGRRLIAEFSATIAISKKLRRNMDAGTTPGGVLAFGRVADRARTQDTEGSSQTPHTALKMS